NDGEVAAVDDAGTGGAGGFNEIREELAQLGRAARDINDLGLMPGDPVADAMGDFGGDHLSAPRSRIHVAMAAGLVAFPPDIDLKGLEAGPAEGQAVG